MNVGQNIANSIPHNTSTPKKFLTPIQVPNFEFRMVETRDLEQVINTLHSKTSTGVDNINSIQIKFLKTELIQPLTLIANQIIKTGIFPSKLKVAKVLTIFKKGDKHQCENYRPISLLSSFSKIFEKILLNQLEQHFNQNNLFFNSQYRFRKKRSTEHAILEVCDRLLTD